VSLIHGQIKAWVFDAYGTLLDPFSKSGEDVPRPGRDSEPALALASARIYMAASADESIRGFLAGHARSSGLCLPQSWFGLRGDTPRRFDAGVLAPADLSRCDGGLEALLGQRLAIPSNGSPRMLEAAVEHAGLTRTFATLMSVDTVRTYKPSPTVYQLAVEALELEKSEIGFVSSNYWDVAGAAAFGF